MDPSVLIILFPNFLQLSTQSHMEKTDNKVNWKRGVLGCRREAVAAGGFRHTNPIGSDYVLLLLYFLYLYNSCINVGEQKSGGNNGREKTRGERR